MLGGLQVIIVNGVVFGALRWLGWLRVSDLDEDQGLDDLFSRGTGSTLLDQLSLREYSPRRWGLPLLGTSPSSRPRVR